MKQRTILFTILAFLATSMDVLASQLSFSYAQPNAPLIRYGFGKIQTYDVAIAIDNTEFQGMSISSIKVPLVPSATSDVDGLKFFITKELKTERIDGTMQNVADFVWDADYPTESNADDGLFYYTFTLPEAYALGEEPVYVGYELNVRKMDSGNEATSSPLVLSSPGIAGGLWLRCSRSVASWTDQAVVYDAVSAICVELTGDASSNAVTLASMEDYMSVVNKSGSVKATITNMGRTVINSIGYTSTLGSTTKDYTLDLSSSPIPGTFGYMSEVTLDVPESAEFGEMPLTLTITHVNTEENTSKSNSLSTNATVIPFRPKPSPVYEEFTGTHCIWCTRGIASMEYMRHKYGSDFHLAVWHSGNNRNDPMWPASGYPQISPGAPSGFMNRMDSADPYFANAPIGYGFEDYWLAYMNRTYPAEVTVEAAKDISNPSLIYVASDVHWAYQPEKNAEYRMEYILIGDSIQGPDGDPRWLQANNYNDPQVAEDMEHMENFVGAGSYIAGMKFNDVALISSQIGGIPSSVASTEMDSHSSDTYTFNTSYAVNNDGEVIRFNPDNLRVLALLLKAGGTAGTIIAANECKVKSNSAGVQNTDADRNKVVRSEYYDITGRKLLFPLNGTIVIRKDVHTDGTITSNKHIFKSK